jgi:serpin B
LFPDGMNIQPAGPEIPAPGINQSTAPSEAEQDVVDANNRFALDMYRKLAADPGSSGENLFFSPLSISSALALTWEGARGSTADEIRSVFHFPGDTGVLRQGYTDINARIAEGDNKYTLRLANALWAEKTYVLLPGYVDIARDYYAAPLSNVDFITAPDDSRVMINLWVEDRTGGKIEDLLPQGTIDESTRLVITNAVYFKGTWVKQFDPVVTYDAEFSVQAGETGSPATIPVRMMQRTDQDAVFGYFETEQYQALRMPYASDGGMQLSMLVLLPKGIALDAVEQSLNPANLAHIRASLDERRVNVYFPKFRLETSSSLATVLAGMGMPTAFSDAADLSGIAGTDDLCISDIVHSAFVEVNEEGTEAAAATGVIIGVTSIGGEDPVPLFLADHPFLFLIIDDETGNILFIGRVVNPGA